MLGESGGWGGWMAQKKSQIQSFQITNSTLRWGNKSPITSNEMMIFKGNKNMFEYMAHKHAKHTELIKGQSTQITEKDTF